MLLKVAKKKKRATIRQNDTVTVNRFSSQQALHLGTHTTKGALLTRNEAPRQREEKNPETKHERNGFGYAPNGQWKNLVTETMSSPLLHSDSVNSLDAS